MKKIFKKNSSFNLKSKNLFLFKLYISRLNFFLNKKNKNIKIISGNHYLFIDDDKFYFFKNNLLFFVLFLINNYIFNFLHLEYFLNKNYFKKFINCFNLYKNLVFKNFENVFFFPKTSNQLVFFKNINKFNYNFCLGPAGSGKTFLSVLYATKIIIERKIEKIILTKPLISFDENIGSLPGTLEEKISPSLKSFYLLLFNFFGIKYVELFLEKNIIEICPFSYIRGKTFNNSIVILDEAQNSTYNQIISLLTRIGINSKIIILGDLFQIDFNNKKSGLEKVVKKFKNNSYFSLTFLKKTDIIRNDFIKDLY